MHDLSALTKADARKLLAANIGKQLCIAYRTHEDGTVIHRAEPRRFALATGVLGGAIMLAACAGHAPEIAVDHPDAGCRDAQGFEVDCDAPKYAGAAVIPDGDAVALADPRTDEAANDETVADSLDEALDQEEAMDPAAEPGVGTQAAAGTVTIHNFDEMPSADDGDAPVGLILVSDRTLREMDDETSDGQSAKSKRKAAREARRASRRGSR